MCLVVHKTRRKPVDNKPLTPEELKIREKIDLFFGGVMLVVAVLVFSIVLWAFIVSS
jgi:hypothetical protein